MKLSIYPWLLVLSLFLLYCGDTRETNPEIAPIAIIPKPAYLEPGEGFFLIDPNTVIVVENEEQQRIAARFTSQFEQVGSWAPSIVRHSEKGDIIFNTTTDIRSEGYRITISSDSIEISASQGAGFFYALQTISQLLPASFKSLTPLNRGNWALPAVRIEDAPEFGWRGFMLDVSRHFFNKEEVKEVIDRISELKMNRFHWHLTDDQGWRIEIKALPKLTEIGAWRMDHTNYDESISDWWGRASQQEGDTAEYGGFYTHEDIQEIVEYAQERYVEILPEIDMPGHSQAAVAAYPEIGCVNAAPFVATGGVYRNNTYNPGKEATYQFIETVLDEVVELFPFDYIHLGGDECNKEQWKVDPHVQNKMKQLDIKTEEEMQSYFITEVEKMINARGKRMIGWDEILEGGLAPNATVMSWRGEEGGITAARAGHQVIMTPSEYCYLDLKQGPDDLEPNLGYAHMFLKDAYQYQLIPESFSEEEAEYILGTQANLWTESITDWGKLTYMTYPRIFAIAENAWTSEQNQDWNDFTARLSHHLDRLDTMQVRYATSAYNVQINHQGVDNGIKFTLDTEVDGLDYYYTVNGKEPDTSSLKYTGPFVLSEGVDLKARAFDQNMAVGKTSHLKFPIHKGQAAKVIYHKPYLDYKDAAGAMALIDYNYGSLTITDDNWQGFSRNLDVELQFSEPQVFKSLRFQALRFTISGVYVPVQAEVWGSNGEEVLLGSKTSLDEGTIQGRNKVSIEIPLKEIQVNSLRIKAATESPIPQGHHRAGEVPKLYIDELVVQ